MNRQEAYKILSAELKTVSDNDLDTLLEFKGLKIETKFLSDSAISYSLMIEIQFMGNNEFELKGSIHDGNSYNFDLLEEKILVTK